MSSSSRVSRLALVCRSLVGSSQTLGEIPGVTAGQIRLYANSKDGKVMHPELLNNSVLKTQYAVRGELYLRAEELRKAGKEIIFTNGKSSTFLSLSIYYLTWLLLTTMQLATRMLWVPSL